METLETYRKALERILKQYASIPYAIGDIHSEVIVDREGGHYLLVNTGWEKYRRVHGTLVHVDIVNDKFWIQRDGTEAGIAYELMEAGVPKDKIVLAFQPEERRTLEGFASE